MPIKTLLRLATASLLALLLSACAVLNPPEQSAVRWELRADPEVPDDAGTPIEGGLQVARVRAESSIDSTSMLYRERDFEPRYYSRNQWVERPTRQLQAALVNSLDAAGIADAVLRSPTDVNTRYRLEVELLALEHDYRVEPPEAELRLRVMVMDQERPGVVASRVIRLREPMEEANPAAGVAATNRALLKALNEIRALIPAVLEAS